MVQRTRRTAQEKAFSFESHFPRGLNRVPWADIIWPINPYPGIVNNTGKSLGNRE
jgi:hypothetical protein